MLDKLTKEAFEPRKGEAFKLTHEAASGALELTLASVQGTGLRGKAPREQFSVHFHGPREPVLPQQIYHLENAEMGTLDLFLVPIARNEEGMIYEAVFT